MELDIIEIRKEKSIELLKLVSNLDDDWNSYSNNSKKLFSWLKNNDYLFQNTSIENEIKNLYELLTNPYNEIDLHKLRQKFLEYRFRKYYFVYKHTVPNGKIYIGVTCQTEVDFRWNSGYKNNISFQKDIDYYGWNNIKHEILYKNLTPEEASNTEKKLIMEYNTTNPNFGYNLDAGGKISKKREDLWAYDLVLQFRGRRRPFKLIVPINDYDKLQSHLKEYTSDIISKDVIFYNSKECFFIKTTNYTFQEKEAIEFIKKYLQIFVETFYCGSFNLDFQYQGINNSTTQFDCLSNTIIINLSMLKEIEYNLRNILYDLAHEYRHKYQYEVVINKTIIPKPFENYTNWEKVLLREVEYIDGSNNYNLYLLQDNEFDANAFAEAVCDCFSHIISKPKTKIPQYYNISTEAGDKFIEYIRNIKENYFKN